MESDTPSYNVLGPCALVECQSTSSLSLEEVIGARVLIAVFSVKTKSSLHFLDFPRRVRKKNVGGFCDSARESIPTGFGCSFCLGCVPPGGVRGSPSYAEKSADATGSGRSWSAYPCVLTAGEGTGSLKPTAGGLASGGLPGSLFSLLTVCQQLQSREFT